VGPLGEVLFLGAFTALSAISHLVKWFGVERGGWRLIENLMSNVMTAMFLNADSMLLAPQVQVEQVEHLQGRWYLFFAPLF
jgi:hypothetical protein